MDLNPRTKKGIRIAGIGLFFLSSDVKREKERERGREKGVRGAVERAKNPFLSLVEVRERVRVAIGLPFFFFFFFGPQIFGSSFLFIFCLVMSGECDHVVVHFLGGMTNTSFCRALTRI